MIQNFVCLEFNRDLTDLIEELTMNTHDENKQLV